MKPLFDEIEVLDIKEGDGIATTEDIVQRESLKFEVATRIQIEEIS